MNRVSWQAFLFLGITFLVFCGALCDEWVTITKKSFVNQSAAHPQKEIPLFFTTEKISPFTQLIFSWNAARPSKGYFAFFVRVRDKKTHKWGVWHHAFDWGHNIQRSYTSKSTGISSYFYVRLEVQSPHLADAFSIKIEPRDSCALENFYECTVTTANFSLLKKEHAKQLFPSMKTVILKGVPSYAQFALDHEDNGRICSPVSCAMVVAYLTQKQVDPLAFAQGVFDTGLGVYGSWPCNIAHAFEMLSRKFSVHLQRCNSFLDIYHQLQKGFPTVVSVRGVLPGALKPFPHGHLLVVTGWDSSTNQVVCHDPGSFTVQGVVKKYALSDFLSAWERSHRLAYFFENNSIEKGVCDG